MTSNGWCGSVSLVVDFVVREGADAEGFPALQLHSPKLWEVRVHHAYAALELTPSGGVQE